MKRVETLLILVSFLFISGCGKLFDGTPSVNVTLSPVVKQANDNGVEANNNRVEKGAVSEGAITVKDGAFKGVEIKFGSTGPVVNMPISAPLMQNNFRKMVWNEATVENESYEYEYFPNGKPAYYKHTLPPVKVQKEIKTGWMILLLIISIWALILLLAGKWLGSCILAVLRMLWAWGAWLVSKIKGKR